jgi:predicted phage gp36 major capsid-like protein
MTDISAPWETQGPPSPQLRAFAHRSEHELPRREREFLSHLYSMDHPYAAHAVEIFYALKQAREDAAKAFEADPTDSTFQKLRKARDDVGALIWYGVLPDSIVGEKRA